MPTVPYLPVRRQPAPRQTRARKPLLPVRVQATLTGSADPADLPDELARGVAMLTIVSGDETDRDVRSYWIRILIDRNTRQPYAVELIRFGDHEKRIVTLDDERCDCPDATYRPDRPGGCKHVVALRQTLPAVANSANAAATATEGKVAA
jgi:hypothetical protein